MPFVIGIVFILLYAILVYYIGWTGWGWMKNRMSTEPSKKFKFLYILTLAIVATSFILGKLTENVILHLIGAYWMALFYLLVILLPLAHVSVWLLRLTRLPHHHIEKGTSSVLLLVLFSLVAYGSYNTYSPTLQTYDIHIDKGNRPQQLKVVLVSDMHFGLLSGIDHAQRMVNEINMLQPDIVMIPGDIIDDDIRPYLRQGIDKIMTQIQAPYGVYASLGNHDKHNGPMAEVIQTLEKSGMHVLYDETLAVNENIQLIGRKDRSERNRATLASLLEGVDTEKTTILLDHQPYELDVAQKLGIDLVLSGHTHHGQVYPGNFITERLFENDWGYLQKEQLHSIVSCGFGFWGPPLRLGSRSEIVQIHLTMGTPKTSSLP
ncbi:metallophosphoesterase [Ammoniphilus sp. YIM 78166]|uniref:metallophosphoesterase n=1 Tax=Ammoniphilus sp. YIM 78166 TaxID=1644106 RepID=UPI00106F2A23|nr:metallophosphoesterase [Ammoniphilus sp. YIM 78166]